MHWLFRSAQDVLPALMFDDSTDDQAAEASSSDIVETPYSGCAWCGDGDGNGLCPSCEATFFPQKGGRA